MKTEQKNIHIQGYPGSFHDQVASEYFTSQINLRCYDSFREQAIGFQQSDSSDYAVMAIENSIAGSILQNYKLIEENMFSIVGETYLKIQMNLLALPGTKLEDIKIVQSHPMALYQCQNYLQQLDIKQEESEDTAKSAKFIKENNFQHIASIASKKAATIYELDIIKGGIEDNKRNYTRFFILKSNLSEEQIGNKASICCSLEHSRGSLAALLNFLNEQNINLTKIQSYPILGKPSQYKFYLDLEFDEVKKEHEIKNLLESQTIDLNVLGLYSKSKTPHFI